MYLSVQAALVVQSAIDDPCKVSGLVQSGKHPVISLLLLSSVNLCQGVLQETALLVPHVPSQDKKGRGIIISNATIINLTVSPFIR